MTSSSGSAEPDASMPTPIASDAEGRESELQDYILLLKQCFPGSSLTAEFITYTANQYAVRAQVQMGDRILSTAMAADASLEIAEDRAKIRAIESLGPSDLTTISPSPASVPAKTIATISAPVPEAPTSSRTKPKPSKPTKSVKPSKDPAVSPASQNRPNPNVSAVDHTPLPSPDLAVPNYVPNYVPDEFEMMSGDMPEAPEPLRMDPEPISPEPISPDPVSPDPVSPESLSPDPISPDPVSPESLSPDPIAPEPGPISPASEAVANNPSSLNTPSPLDPSKAGGEGGHNVNLVDAIAKTSVEMQRLGWDINQGREHLLATYGKRSRGELTDDELLNFLQFLEQQPNVTHRP